MRLIIEARIEEGEGGGERGGSTIVAIVDRCEKDLLCSANTRSETPNTLDVRWRGCA